MRTTHVTAKEELDASLAPNAEITVFPWRDPPELKARTINRVRNFLRAHRPATLVSGSAETHFVLKWWPAAALLLGTAAFAAPDEDRLGKALGYPVGNAANWYWDEGVRVGSFTHEAEIPGIFAGKVHVLQRSPNPMPLPMAEREPAIRWTTKDSGELSVDDFLERQRIMGLIVVKDGVIGVERYQYDRKATDRFVSQSMAKSITALAVGIALGEGHFRSLDDRTDQYAPKLRGTIYGDTTLRNLLRMASGARYEQTFDGTGDSGRFASAVAKLGVEGAARIITVRDGPQGTHFHYASAQTTMLGAALRGATGMSLSEYLTPRLWQAIGAEESALWYTDRTGLEVTLGNFNATLRDYARLGVVLANDGVRPDDSTRKQIIPLEFLLDATDWQRAPEPFRPGKATSYLGYGYQIWTFPGSRRRFAFLGVYGQSIFVDPGLKLVVVQTGANATPDAGKTSLARERLAFWRGVVSFYGKW